MTVSWIKTAKTDYSKAFMSTLEQSTPSRISTSTVPPRAADIPEVRRRQDTRRDPGDRPGEGAGREKGDGHPGPDAQLFANAFENAFIGMALACPDGRFLRVNPALCRITGYTREELTGRHFRDITHADDIAEDNHQVERVLSGEISGFQMEKRYVHKDGRAILVLLSVSMIRDADGSPLYFIGQIQDITERRQAETLSNHSQRLESIGTLAGGVAHDLNNALLPILLSVEILRSKLPGHSDLVDSIQSSATRSVKMVRQLLTFAKGSEGERIPLQWEHMFSEIENIVTGTFPKNIRLDINSGVDVPPVFGDPTQLHQILLNLCVNARDAMPRGGTLTLETERQNLEASAVDALSGARPGCYVVMRVVDNGTGIPPEMIGRIFDPFFTTKGPDKGTGLGLSTIAGIVKSHGGFVRVKSKPGRGAAFSVYLPAAEPVNNPSPPPKSTAKFRGNNELVLVVDDERPVRDAVRRVLRRMNLKTITATDGADGLVQAMENRQDIRLIIADLHMPHMDGLNYVRVLNRLLPGVPVIVSSGRVDEYADEELKKLGVNMRLDKPFTERALAAVFEKILAAR